MNLTTINEITIRKANPDDTKFIFSLIKELAIYEKLSDQVVVDEHSLRKSLFPNGDSKVAHVLIAELNGQPSAYALYFYSFSTFLGKPGIYLEDLYVKESLRGQGIGKKLLLEVIKVAKEEGLGRVEWSCLDWNTPSIKFYESLGAKSMNDWSMYRLTEEQFDDLLK